MEFSVIIPVYNVDPYLRECLDSVLAQTYTDWECICIDDGSTDGSGRILDEYAQCDTRIVVRHQKNAGVSCARNAALSIATGEWLLFLDGDDLFDRSSLETLSAVIREHPHCQLVKFSYTRFPNGESCCFDKKDPRKVEVRDVHDIVYGSDFRCVFAQYAYQNELIKGVQFKQYSLGEDMLFLMHALQRADSICSIDDCLYGYRQHAYSATHTVMNRSRLTDVINFRMDALTLALNGKRMDRDLSHNLCVLATEDAVSLIEKLPTQDRDAMWRLWFDRVKTIKATKDLSLWFAMVFKLCSTFKYRILAKMLCLLPLWIKRKGFHR